MIIECPISPGELIDKISILEIKRQKIQDAVKTSYIRRELEVLRPKLRWIERIEPHFFLKRLIDINSRLWTIEDCLRLKEAAQSFDGEFIYLARQVYKMNDKRFAVKDEINKSCGHFLREVKSYG